MHKHSEGYLLTSTKKFVHRVIASKALGKPLKRSHRVHHVDGVRDNNDNSNLVLCENQSYHRLLHLRSKSLEGSGHADYFRCPECKGWKPQDKFSGKINGCLCKACRRIGNPRFRSKKTKYQPNPPLLLVHGNVAKTNAGWARHFGINSGTLHNYLNKHGHTIHEAVEHYS